MPVRITARRSPIGPDGTRHAVWFNQVERQGRAFYGHLREQGPGGCERLPAGATHADVAVAGRNVAIAWKRFDGNVTSIESLISKDRGHFAPGPSLQTAGDSDQPRLVRRASDMWSSGARRTSIAVRDLADRAGSRRIKPFESRHAARSSSSMRGKQFWLVLWDLECSYCMKSLSNLAQRSAATALKVVTISTDPIEMRPSMQRGSRSSA